jgi:hypothetical protein
MNQAERDRLDSLKRAKKKLITQEQATAEIGVTERQVRRLLRKQQSWSLEGLRLQQESRRQSDLACATR